MTQQTESPTKPSGRGDPAIYVTLKATSPTTMKSSGFLVTPNVTDWVGSDSEIVVESRWIPGGADLDDIGGSLTLAFGSSDFCLEQATEAVQRQAAQASADHSAPPDGAEPVKDYFYDQISLSELLYHFEYLRTDDEPATLPRRFPWATWASERQDTLIRWTGDLGSMRSAGAWLYAYYDEDVGLHTVQLRLGFESFSELLEAMRKVTSGCFPIADEPFDFMGFPIGPSIGNDCVEIEHSWWRSDHARYEVLGEFWANLRRYDGSPARSGCFLTVKKFLQ